MYVLLNIEYVAAVWWSENLLFLVNVHVKVYKLIPAKVMGYPITWRKKNQFTIRTHFIQEILILPKPTQNIFYWCSKNLFCGISEKTWCEERLTLFTPSLTATMLFLFVFTGALSKWESCFLFTNKIQLQPINQFS